MLCCTHGEFRGQEQKTGKTGNNYYILYFEELETGKAFNMMSADPVEAKRGQSYRIYFNLTIASTYTRVKVTKLEEMVQ